MDDYRSYKNDKVVRFVDSLKHSWRIFPPSLQIGITDSCFNKCPMCGHWRRKKKYSLNTERLIRFLEMGKKLGLESVGYSGGDPLAYAKINDVMKWHIGNNVSFGIVTAGYVPYCVEYSLLRCASWVRVSLDAVGEERYRKFRGSVAFSDVDRSINDMLDARVRLGVGITLHSGNSDYVGEVLDYCKSKGIEEVRVWVVRRHSKMDMSFKQRMKLASTLAKYLEDDYYSITDTNFSTTIDTLTSDNIDVIGFDRCYACLYQLFIDSDGSIYACCTAAGDTESKSRMEPFSNIYFDMPIVSSLGWERIAKKVRAFHSKEYSDLPDVCKDECIVRHRIANNIAMKSWHRQDFQ